MLVTVPAGGGWVHLSLAFSISLFSAVEEATDGVRRFLLHSQRCFFSLSSALPPWLEGNMPGKHGDVAWHPALHCHKGQLLTERGRPFAYSSYKHSATSPWTCATATALVEWRQFFIQMKYALSRSRRMPNLNLSTLETSCKRLISQ